MGARRASVERHLAERDRKNQAPICRGRQVLARDEIPLKQRDRPFNSRSLPALLEAIRCEPIARLPPRLVRYQPLVDRLLAKDPEDRFQNACELIVETELAQAAAWSSRGRRPRPTGAHTGVRARPRHPIRRIVYFIMVFVNSSQSSITLRSSPDS